MHSSTMRGVFTVAVVTGIAAGSTRSFLTPRAQQSNQSRRFGPGVCGPADPVYLRITNETGGQPFFMSPAEIGKSALVMAASASDDGLILWATGTIADAGQGFAIPVDPSISRLSLAATFDGTGGTFSVVAPDGVTVKASPRTQETVLNCGRLLTIDAPAAGAWRLQVVPSSRFWLIARGRTDLDLLSAEFVRLGGRPGHEGLFKIPGQPVAGQAATLRVQIAEPQPELPAFVLMSLQGRPIRHVSLTRVDDEEFDGPIDLPSEPFRVSIVGVDQSGAPYQRMRAGLFHAENVELLPAGDSQMLQPGEETAVSFVVRNVGPRARYRILAVDANHFVARVEPESVELDSRAEQIVKVVVRVPAGAPAGTGLELTITATSDGPPQTSNSAVRRFTVAGGR
jgi:von Willebrand factor A domain-containing protein 7